MNEDNTSAGRVSRGRGVGQVAFLFGLAGRTELPGVVLRRMLADLDTSDDASRALLARMVRDGALSSTRQGRTTTYALAGEFLLGWDRVRRQAMTRPLPWEGEFHAILHAVPEAHRGYRDTLRRAAVLAGYGTLQPGVLISLTDRRQVLAAVLDEAPAGAHVRLGTLGLSAADAAAAASVAWDLPGLAAVYAHHVAHLDAARPQDLRGYVEALQPALTDTLREPALDPALLPRDWPGPALRRAFGRFQERHEPLVQAYLADVLDAG